MPLTLDWKISSPPMPVIGLAVGRTLVDIVREEMPDLADMFPLQSNWHLEWYFCETWMAFRFTGQGRSATITTRDFTPSEVEQLQQQILPFIERNHTELFQLLGAEWFAFDKFTYVGPFENSSASWADIFQHLIDWLNHLVVPEILRRNQSRVLRVIPSPPRFDLNIINQSLWVLECEETIKQGTGFMLAGTGLITCQHVLGTATHAIHPASSLQKFPVRVLAQNSVVDLAILSIDTNVGIELTRGSADELQQMEHIAVAGFPNFRLGDSGIISPGLVVGFRMMSGIRRILTNAPIIAGNSGGPVLASGNIVVGVAVTGADRMEKAQETEDHGIIPIDALQYL